MVTNWKVTTVQADRVEVAVTRERGFTGLRGGEPHMNHWISVLLAQSMRLASVSGANAENYRSST
jgi:hypothetical protein